ncbi:MAG: hypothetical protein U0934_00310 [Pseudotabrizicola sp.]|uniref:hypothetical protein n=1 Tax=Pseudotabrizicola sp. TaxID=2939647 RepID=UPI0027170C1B|nr:hypothetical protein [Pseudotabrizicola sp.]MDO8881746.1 hypothetical protein [Pseudotabrizicola sp.]MDP2079552.1 hypothetical protein [Pseudotabrizicola sp.]MDZ7572384.1 hypothetical protein [Pseudotabrizicola sp.]
MTALTSPNTFYKIAAPLTALQRAQSATVDYCTITATEHAHSKLRDLTALDTMYAYFGSDEATD